jgi:hypothetical protein
VQWPGSRSGIVNSPCAPATAGVSQGCSSIRAPCKTGRIDSAVTDCACDDLVSRDSRSKFEEWVDPDGTDTLQTRREMTVNISSDLDALRPNPFIQYSAIVDNF